MGDGVNVHAPPPPIEGIRNKVKYSFFRIHYASKLCYNIEYFPIQ